MILTKIPFKDSEIFSIADNNGNDSFLCSYIIGWQKGEFYVSANDNKRVK